ncbi:MAG: hypothetical protein CL488_05375 [Acidobacteria bacterium]|nr:hypothetical protein [Acidobacteriota bacterium]
MTKKTRNMTSKVTNHTVHDVCDAIRAHHHFVVVSHARPDGDAVGSQVAMGLALKALDKHVRLISADPVPDIYRELSGVDDIEVTSAVTGSWDAAIVMECTELSRAGLTGLNNGFVMNIDHHPGNTFFGDVNYFDESAAACGELVFSVLQGLQVPLTVDIATHLYIAILTDTGSFHHGPISTRTFEICGRLTRAGADPRALANKMFDQYKVGRLQVIATMLSEMQMEDRDRVAVLTIDESLLTQSNATLDDLDGLVNLPLTTRTVQAAILFKSAPGQPLRVSLRSKGDVNVRVVAAVFGGGGHVNASGFTLESTAEDKRQAAIQQVVAAVNTALGPAVGEAPSDEKPLVRPE